MIRRAEYDRRMESARLPVIEVSFGQSDFVPVLLLPREVMHGVTGQPLNDRVTLALPGLIPWIPIQSRPLLAN